MYMHHKLVLLTTEIRSNCYKSMYGDTGNQFERLWWTQLFIKLYL